jgi:hypothetical protein
MVSALKPLSLLSAAVLAFAFTEVTRGADAVPPTAAANIHRYVAEHRGWSRAAYHIERYPDEHDYAVFAVVHRDDEKPRAETGRGKSFALYCDRRTFRVIKEMWFQ